MIRQPQVERSHRLECKTLDQAALVRLQEDFGCSPFESRAILQMMHGLFESVWQSASNLKPGQMVVLAIAAHEPAGKPLKDCQFKPIVITVHDPEDEALRQRLQGRQLVGELRRAKLRRIAGEALAQDAYLTVEDVANRILNCGERTLERDLEILRKRGEVVPLRGQQADIGRTVSHKVQVVRLALQRQRPHDIARRLHHDIDAVERYLADFAAIATLLADGWAVETISFVRRVSLALVREYQRLYEEANQPVQREALADLIRQWGPEGGKKTQLTSQECWR
jgi:hypothetical protein